MCNPMFIWIASRLNLCRFCISKVFCFCYFVAFVGSQDGLNAELNSPIGSKLSKFLSLLVQDKHLISFCVLPCES